MKDLETIIREIVAAKKEQDNQIDLHAYENGMRAFAKAINYSQCCKSDSEQLCDHIYFDNAQKPDNCIYCNHKREHK